MWDERPPVSLVLCLGLALVAAAAPEDGAAIRGRPTDQVVASVGEEVITAERFVEEMKSRGGEVEGQYQSVTQRRALLEELVLRMALVSRAREEGYEDDPEVRAILERTLVARLLRDQLDRELEKVSVSNDDVEAFYLDHQEEYARPARYEAAIVMVAVPPKAGQERRQKARKRIEKALQEARNLDASIRHFGPVAQNYSDDRASRYLGGSIGWLLRHPGQAYRWDEAVVEAIFTLESPGQLGPVVESDSGFYLVKLIAYEESRQRPLDSLREGIRVRIGQDRKEVIRRSFFQEILDETAVEIDDAVLESVGPPRPTRPASGDPLPPPVPELGSEAKGS